VEVETSVLEGNPAVEITKFAAENGADLIVMGTLGKSGIDRILLGSTAEKVIQHRPLPRASDQERKKSEAPGSLTMFK